MYSYPADVWSIGVIMIVTMAGYPSFEVEKAFTIMQTPDRDLRGFPMMAENLPDDYFNFVSKLLNVDPARRAKCKDMMSDPFITTVLEDSPGRRSPHPNKRSKTLSQLSQSSDEVRFSDTRAASRYSLCSQTPPSSFRCSWTSQGTANSVISGSS